MAHRVTFIPGDGVGPELSEATRRVLEGTGVQFDWDVQEAGAEVIDKYGTPLPDQVLDSIRGNGVAIKGPLTTPIGTGFRSVNVALRKELDLYACLRPCKTYQGVRSRYDDIDLVVVRENHEDLYAGIEFEQGTPDAAKVIEFLNGLQEKKIRDDSGISIKPMSITGTRRIAKFAFDYARAYGRKKVTAVTKANIMKHTDGLFYAVAREVAKEYDDIEYDEYLVDNMCMQLVQKPENFDVLLLPNLYGDILSDLGAGLVGGLGVAPGANLGDRVAVFEATHGSAPKYKGQNKVNPMAMMLSGMLMLRHLEEGDAADRLERALAAVIAEGESVTYDMKPSRDDPTAVGTSQVADAVIAKLEESSLMPRVTVVGAGKYGSTTVQRLAEKGIADEVVMTDIVEGLPQGLALDMNQSRSIEGFETRVVGSNGYQETAGSDVVVITAGVPRKPGMSRMDLLETNAKIVGEVTRKVADASPDAVLIVVSNPLDEMTSLAAEVSGFPRERVMGQAGMLDTARFKHFLAEELGTSPGRVEAMTLGSHGDTMVPVPSMVKVDGKPLTEVADADTIERLVQRTRDGGAEVVALLKSGSAYYAPSSAAAAMVAAVLGDTGEVMPVCAWVTGQYGIDGVYLGVPAKLGRAGVAEVVELPLTDTELAELREAAEAVRSKQADVAKLIG